jgi:release factor glutamine methyltransferase
MYLKENFDFSEAKSEVDFALDTLFNYTYKDFLVGKALEDWQIAKVNKVFEERVSTHKPIQQLIGQAYFYGRRFFVDESTLIPRPETEILVSKILEYTKEFTVPQILDIGTGSGCIPITLVLGDECIQADAVDVSYNAIEMAKKNAIFHNVSKNIKFFKSDLFENINRKYDIIVSNPPYIPLKDKDKLQIEVKDFDPPTALFTKDDLGIDFYRKIISQAKKYLNPKGYLAFEIGINQSEPVQELLKANDYKEIQVFKDYNAIDRVIISKNDN